MEELGQLFFVLIEVHGLIKNNTKEFGLDSRREGTNTLSNLGRYSVQANDKDLHLGGIELQEVVCHPILNGRQTIKQNSFSVFLSKRYIKLKVM